ncbi:adenylyltransferase/cytidyltransferase family protein [Patescibacteria group bacterium]|nr:adenylyltransferase/cytidyltransferase family protein [Patescibacteria group bacterium]
MNDQFVQKKIITDYKDLEKKIKAHKTLGHRVVCTIGSWDMLHIGHMRYLHKAAAKGDILVVGADSDRGIRLYKKNELRPVIPEEERMEMLAYQDCVDYVTLVDDVSEEGTWQYDLIIAIQPDVFIAVADSYPKKQIEDIQKFVGEVVQLPRQALRTSSTKIIEKTVKNHLESMLQAIQKR